MSAKQESLSKIPEFYLWGAVIAQAVEDALSPCPDMDKGGMTKEQREREASKIRNSARSSICSREFDALCEMLNLDASFAEQVRKAVGENRKFEPMYSTRYRGGEAMR